jgi:LCP family protein required for cell wall assembly
MPDAEPAGSGPAADDDTGDDSTRDRPWYRRPLGMALLGVAMLAVFVLAVPVALWLRVDRFELDAPGSAAGGTTTLIIGSDSREDLGETDAQRFGGVDVHPGERADIVLLLRRDGSGTSILPLRRDLLVLDGSDGLTQLTLTYRDGAQGVVDSLCQSLGLGVDHVVVTRFQGLRDVIDAVGGVDVEVAEPVHDEFAGLHIDSPGPVHLDGDEALAFVRSREDIELGRDEDGVADGTPAGGRAARARVVLEAAGRRMDLSPWSPITALRRLWAMTGAVAVDEHMGIDELSELARTLRGLDGARELTLPVEADDEDGAGTGVLPESRKVLDAIGGTGDDCEPSLLAQEPGQ